MLLSERLAGTKKTTTTTTRSSSLFCCLLLLVATTSDVLGQISFPNKPRHDEAVQEEELHQTSTAGLDIRSALLPLGDTQKVLELPQPAACANDDSICGEDPEKYPVEAIDKIVLQSIELQIAPEATERFFGGIETTDGWTNLNEENLEPTCKSRVEMIPRYARAKNVFGKWVYLVEAANKLRQHVQIVLCADNDVPCSNDLDSPHGEGTTVCKQLYRTQKLLAVDKNQDIVVDTFKLPSACVCNYKGKFGFHLRNALGPSRAKDPPKCTVDNANRNLDTLDNLESMRTVPPLQLSNATSAVTPCDDDDVLCENDDGGYPSSAIDGMLTSHVAFKSPAFFGTIFGDICEPPPDQSNVVVRGGFDAELSELCSSYQKYIYPKKAKNINGEWHFIINTDQYKQGVTVEICFKGAKDAPCRYGGSEGIDPSGTVCKQLYSVHHMLAVKTNGTVSYEPFSIPSSCSCYAKADAFYDSDSSAK